MSETASSELTDNQKALKYDGVKNDVYKIKLYDAIIDNYDRFKNLHDGVKDQIFTDGVKCDEDCFSLITPANCEMFNEELEQNAKEQSMRCENCIGIFGNRSD